MLAFLRRVLEALMQLVKTLRLGPPGQTLQPSGVEGAGELGTLAVSRSLALAGFQATAEIGTPGVQIVAGGTTTTLATYTNLAALFSSGNVYKATGSSPEANPMDLAIPLSPSTNAEGWSAFDQPWTTVVDPQRGTVTRCFYPAGMTGGGSPQRALGPKNLYSTGPAVAISSASRGTYTGSTTLFTIVTSAPHGLTTGDVVLQAGSGTSGYTGLVQVTVVNATTYTYTANGAPTTPAVGSFTTAKATLAQEIGFGAYLKVDAAWSNNGNVGTKLLFIQDGISSEPNAGTRQNHYVNLLDGSPGRFKPNVRLQQGGGFRNIDLATDYPLGAWYKLEVYWKANTPGVSNGIARAWVDGVQVVNATDVMWVAAGQAPGFAQVWFDGTFGGGSNPVPADQAWYIDDVLVASKAPGTTPNISALPAATGQLESSNPTLATLAALRAMAAGGSWLDGISGARGWKLASTTVPQTGVTPWGGYSEGANWVGRRHSGVHTIGFYSPSYGGRWCDLTPGASGGVGNYRTTPGGASQSFGNTVANAHICFVHTGSAIRRWNVESMAWEDTGYFGTTVPNCSQWEWFQHDKDDVWFIWRNGTTVYAWNSLTNQLLSTVKSGLDEPYLELNGRYVMLQAGGSTQIWDLQTNTVASMSAAILAVCGWTHVPATRHYWQSMDSNSPVPNRIPVYHIPSDSLTVVPARDSTLGGYFPDFHRTCWPQAVGDKTQWVLWSHWGTYPENGNATGGGVDASRHSGRALIFERLDGSERRFFAHHWSHPELGPDTYQCYPKAQISPDGLIVGCSTNFSAGSTIWPIAYEVPTA